MLPDSAECALSPYQGTWCTVAATASPEAVQTAMNFICTDGGVNCSRCTTENATIRANWAYNEFLQAHLALGPGACFFGGTGELQTPPFSPCRPSLRHRHVCQPRVGARDDGLRKALAFVCGDGGLDCSMIRSSGKCIFEDTVALRSSCDWAFDAYYHAHSVDACDFNGVAEVVLAKCGEYQGGDPRTGRGFAYPDESCDGTSPNQCGCIGKSGCRQCVTKNSNAAACQYLCPWINASRPIPHLQV